MKLETLDDWKKEARYLYGLLEYQFKQQREEKVKNWTDKDQAREMVEATWTIYKIENNLKEEDYKI